MQPLDAERVKEWRHRRMLSQQEVADRAGTSLFTVQRIERGEGNVRPKTGRGIAAALGVSIEELLPKAQAPLFQEPLEHELSEQRRADAYELALDAARRQATQDRQAFNRLVESERPQTYFKHYENAAITRLLQYPADELAGVLMEMALRVAELENERRKDVYLPWLEFAHRYAERWDNKIEGGQLDRGALREGLDTLRDLVPTIGRLRREEEHGLAPAQLSAMEDELVMWKVASSLVLTLTRILDTDKELLETSELAQFRRMREQMEQEWSRAANG